MLRRRDRKKAMTSPPAPRALVTSDPILRSGRDPLRTPTPHDPLDQLRALATQDLSPMERDLVDAEIHIWEHHRRLQAWTPHGATPAARD
jgi:hypothetical protein